MYARIALVACLSLTAVPVQAQDFLGGLARRAAASAAGQVVGRAIAGQTGQTEQNDQPAAPAAQPAAANPPAAPAQSRRRSSRDDAPEAEGVHGMSEEARFPICSQRYSTKGLEGGSPAWMERSEQFGRCMGPHYGDGG